LADIGEGTGDSRSGISMAFVKTRPGVPVKLGNQTFNVSEDIYDSTKGDFHIPTMTCKLMV
jgi:hypothetical protein